MATGVLLRWSSLPDDMYIDIDNDIRHLSSQYDV